eukprot:5187555-Amphidinium_carterae.1
MQHYVAQVTWLTMEKCVWLTMKPVSDYFGQLYVPIRHGSKAPAWVWQKQGRNQCAGYLFPRNWHLAWQHTSTPKAR